MKKLNSSKASKNIKASKVSAKKVSPKTSKVKPESLETLETSLDIPVVSEESFHDIPESTVETFSDNQETIQESLVVSDKSDNTESSESSEDIQEVSDDSRLFKFEGIAEVTEVRDTEEIKFQHHQGSFFSKTFKASFGTSEYPCFLNVSSSTGEFPDIQEGMKVRVEAEVLPIDRMLLRNNHGGASLKVSSIIPIIPEYIEE